MAHILSVSCVDDLFQVLKQKNISPSEALRVGILKLANEEPPFDPSISYEETPQAQIEKLKRQNAVMQEHILKLNDELGVKNG